MLLNRDIPAEVRAYINACGKKKADIARGIGVTPMRLNSILVYTKMLDGDEKWILALDEAGYDVEVRIKPKKK